MRSRKTLAAAAFLIAVAGTSGWLYQSTAQEKTTPPAAVTGTGKPQNDTPDVAAIRKSAQAFAKAFNAGDAKAVASFWMPDGEYTSPAGVTLHGRAAIEKVYAEFFKSTPKAHVDVTIESIRPLGKNAALEEGTLELKVAGETQRGVSRYSVLHVRDDDGWRMATVREWVPDSSELITLKDVEWLVGSWTAKSDVAELAITYRWDEDKAYIKGRYQLKRDGKASASGTQIIGKNPDGGLRSWVFDASGSFGESVWTQDDNRWVIEAAGTLRDGSEITAVNVLIPLGPDAFTWQAVERFAGGAPLPGTPPIKVTRVKGGK